MRALRAWTASRPGWASAAGMIPVTGLLLPDAAEASGGLGVFWLVLGAVSLLVRDRRPAEALVVVLAIGAAAYLSMPGYAYFPLALTLVAVHAVALRAEGRVLWGSAAAATLQLTLVVLLVLVGTPAGPDGETVPLWGGLALALSLLSAALLLGINTRVRRAHLAALEDRAHRLELDRELDLRLAVAAERSRIAGEMHDIVAHSLTVMITLADGLAARAASGRARPPEPERLRAVSATGRQALDEMRRLLGLLGDVDEPRRRTPLPGVGDLPALLDQVRAAGMPVELTRQGDLPGLSAGAGLTVYRIVQEALTNSLKHAGPGARATVLVRAADRRVEIEVVDDGVGGVAPTGPLPVPGGHGLPGMAQRTASYGGSLHAGPGTPIGWRVHAVLHTSEAHGDRPTTLTPAAR